MKLSSQTLFKGTVFLLGIPALLFLAIAILVILTNLVRGQAGIGSFTFGVTVTQREMTLVAVLLGFFVLFAFLGVALTYRKSRRKANTDR